MKIKIFLSAFAAALLLTSTLYAGSSHEMASRTASQAQTTPQAPHPMMGEGVRTLPQDMPHTAATTTDAQTASSMSATSATAPVATVSPTDRSPRSARQQQRGPAVDHRDPSDQSVRGSGFGVASLVLGILAITIGWLFAPFGILLAILAIVFGGIGIGRNRRGKGMAIAGLVLGFAYLVIIALLVALLVVLLA
jgi:hypothetical protein